MSLATGEEEYAIVSQGNGLTVSKVPAFRMPECYIRVKDPEDATEYILPSQNMQLNWSVAITAEALGVVGMCVREKDENSIIKQETAGVQIFPI